MAARGADEAVAGNWSFFRIRSSGTSGPFRADRIHARGLHGTRLFIDSIASVEIACQSVHSFLRRTRTDVAMIGLAMIGLAMIGGAALSHAHSVHHQLEMHGCNDVALFAGRASFAANRPLQLDNAAREPGSRLYQDCL